MEQTEGIRPMTLKDLAAVADLEQSCFSESWSENLLRSGLECSLDTYLVYGTGDRIQGYCVFRCLGNEGELQRIGVKPEFRGRGIGRKLMEAMFTLARMKGVQTMSLEVREGNETARNLYESCGFKQEAVRRGYYHNPTEDALIMWNRRI